jgi:predicted transposase YbfD/YdcC
VAFSSRLKPGCPKVFFPSEYDSGWQKEHGRLERWRLQRVAVTPEEAGLIGCWQFLAVWRDRQYLRRGKVVKQSEEYSLYTCSLARDERTAQELAGAIRGHWNASEIGSHYRRDVTLGEDACQISGRSGAQVMAALRNTVLGLFELQKDRGKTKARFVPTWKRGMSATQALKLITKGM